MTAPVVQRASHALQEYQSRLNDALADESVDTDAVIAMAIGQQGWLVSLHDLSEASLCPDLAKTGSMPAGVLGVGNFRGKVNTVVSMPRLCGAPEEGGNADGWTTVLHPRFEIAIALWWPKMLGLFPRSDFVRHDATIPSVCRASWISPDARVWYELDTERVLSEKLGVGESSSEVASGV